MAAGQRNKLLVASIAARRTESKTNSNVQTAGFNSINNRVNHRMQRVILNLLSFLSLCRLVVSGFSQASRKSGSSERPNHRTLKPREPAPGWSPRPEDRAWHEGGGKWPVTPGQVSDQFRGDGRFSETYEKFGTETDQETGREVVELLEREREIDVFPQSGGASSASNEGPDGGRPVRDRADFVFLCWWASCGWSQCVTTGLSSGPCRAQSLFPATSFSKQLT